MVEVEVEKIIWKGRGLGRLSSGKKVIILPPVLPKEKIAGDIVVEKKDYVEIIPKKIIEVSPYRIPHPCVFFPKCGGCSFGVVNDNYEIELKKELFHREFLRATKGILGDLEGKNIEVFPSPKKWGYRWRGQVFVKGGKPHFKQLKTNKMIPFDRCLLFAPPINDMLNHVVEDICDKRVVICASPLNHRVYTELDRGELILPYARYGFDLKVRPGTFFQANWDLNQELVDFVVAATKGFDNIADLYAGCGNFSIPLAVLNKNVLAIENNIWAVRAILDFCENSPVKLEVEKMDLKREDPVPLLKKRRIECVIVDPPRSGGGRFVEELLKHKYLERIVWISCDIVNTARDIMVVLKNGWQIRKIGLFDMFPNTFHMEVVFVLDKKGVV